LVQCGQVEKRTVNKYAKQGMYEYVCMCSWWCVCVWMCKVKHHSCFVILFQHCWNIWPMNASSFSSLFIPCNAT
jgi:hypothetical protein